ncbi:hypothetical protein [Streptomyces microflavus]|uniref:hypothetical protein n=1 Tax=Streptomyces microflavus TaxID=1919 RepID=UPI002E31FFE9|nr:hypothetical protein [Streptomyces microflavus]
MTHPADPLDQTPLAAHILDLAGHFTRRQDDLSHVPLYTTLLARLGPHLYQQLARTTELGEHARRVRDVVEAHHAGRLAYDMNAASRITQLAFLAMNAGDLLVSALDTLEAAHPVGRDEEEALLRQVAAPVNSCRELLRHAAGDAVDAAAAFARSATRCRRFTDAPEHDHAAVSIRLTDPQLAALTAVARGLVTIDKDATQVFSGPPRLSISTLRSLHSRDATEHLPFARSSGAQRVTLSPKGRLVLAATFGRPPGPVLSTRSAATATNSSVRTGTRAPGAR